MNHANRHQLSAHSDTLTQQSPQKYSAHRSISPSGVTHHQNIQIEYLRLKQHSKRQLDAYCQQIDLLKQQLYRKNQEIQNLEDNVILKLRHKINQCMREQIKYSQSQQKLKKQSERIKSDNQSLSLQNQRLKKERKIYSEKLEHIKSMYDDIKKELDNKQNHYRKYYERVSTLEKQIQNMRYENEDLRTQIRQRERQVYQSENEYKNMLQRNFMIENELKTIQIKYRDQELIMSTYKDKINELEKQRGQFLDRLEDYQRYESSEQYSYNDQDKQSLIQIQSLITQVNNLLDRKQHERDRSLNTCKKFKTSLACLEKTLKK